MAGCMRCMGAGAWVRGAGCTAGCLCARGKGAGRVGTRQRARGCGAGCLSAWGTACLGYASRGSRVRGARYLHARDGFSGHDAWVLGAAYAGCGTWLQGAGCLQAADGWLGAVGATPRGSAQLFPGAWGSHRAGRARTCESGGPCAVPDPPTPFLPPLPAAGDEGQGAEAVLQGHRAGQGDAAHRGLRRLPLGRAAQPALHRAHREHVGVLGQQHGGQGQVVLPPRGDQAGQAAERRQGEGWAGWGRGGRWHTGEGAAGDAVSSARRTPCTSRATRTRTTCRPSPTSARWWDGSTTSK